MTAPIVQVSHFVRTGTGWLGNPLEVHPVAITDVGGQFDWFCTLESCRIISEGLPSGDSHSSVAEAERDTVRAHAEDGVPLDVHPSAWRPASQDGVRF